MRTATGDESTGARKLARSRLRPVGRVAEVTVPPDQFYTGLVSYAYAPLRSARAPSAPYEAFVRRYGEPALELGCGHGEPLLDLVACGLDVSGLDSSADMLDRCRVQAARRSLDVRLHCQRMERMQLGTTFASIYLAGPTFQLVVDLDEARAALRSIAAHLRPGGAALVPLFIPERLTGDAFGIWRTDVDETGREVAVQAVSQSYRPAERRVDTVLRYRAGPASAPTDTVERTWSLRWYASGEFDALAVDAGLEVAGERGTAAARSVILRLPSTG